MILRYESAVVGSYSSTKFPYLFKNASEKKHTRPAPPSSSSTHMNICVSADFPAPAAPTTMTFCKATVRDNHKMNPSKKKRVAWISLAELSHYVFLSRRGKVHRLSSP